VWRSKVLPDVYFKWCKGCKRFHNILMFREKLQGLRGGARTAKLPSKCDPCRQRGRQGYRSKKVWWGGRARTPSSTFSFRIFSGKKCDDPLVFFQGTL
jgi:hypothetical protein